jgi:hypothetical protein
MVHTDMVRPQDTAVEDLSVQNTAEGEYKITGRDYAGRHWDALYKGKEAEYRTGIPCTEGWNLMAEVDIGAPHTTILSVPVRATTLAKLCMTAPLPSQPRQRSLLTEKEDNDRRRYVELDKNGKPRGKMADLVKRDVHAFTKELDPNEGWEKQKDESKSRLKQRLDAEYEFGGESALLGEKYLQKQVTKGLINFRFNLNQRIDQGHQKPPKLRQEFWEALVKKRSTSELKERSERMANIARGRATKNSTRKALEKTV